MCDIRPIVIDIPSIFSLVFGGGEVKLQDKQKIDIIIPAWDLKLDTKMILGGLSNKNDDEDDDDKITIGMPGFGDFCTTKQTPVLQGSSSKTVRDTWYRSSKSLGIHVYMKLGNNVYAGTSDRPNVTFFVNGAWTPLTNLIDRTTRPGDEINKTIELYGIPTLAIVSCTGGNGYLIDKITFNSVNQTNIGWVDTNQY